MNGHQINKLRRALVAIEGSPNCTLAEVATAAHLSPFHFARLFRDATGLTVNDYQRRRQLARAVELMSSSETTLLEVALGAGFSSHEAMTRAFRRAFGMLPSTYRSERPALRMQRRIEMPTQEETISAAELTLREQGYPDAELTTPGSSLSEHGWPTVIRTTATGIADHASVIVKTYRSWSPYDPDSATGPSTGFFAEWAAVEFLSALDGFPTFMAGDRERGVVIQSDLPNQGVLDISLEAAGAADQDQLLENLAERMATMHGESIGRRSDYLAVRQRLGPTPHDVSTDEYLAQAREVLDLLTLELSRDDLTLIDTAENRWLDENAWWGLQHLDPAQDNLLINDGDVSIVDFEGSVYGHILRDVAFVDMAWGHTAATRAVTENQAQRFETRYFQVLSDSFGLVDLVRDADEELIWAKLALALEVLGSMYQLSSTEKHAPWGGARVRAQMTTQWQRLAKITPLRTFATRVIEALHRSWRDQGLSVAALPYYGKP
ncbi:MAG: helix-turn-helix domain-containing protein [Pseudomonadota bacterium]